MTPYDWTGPSFLGLYGFASVLSIAGALTYRTLQVSSVRGTQPPPEMAPYEMAYLAGGTETAILAALASLIQSESIKVDSISGGKYVKVQSGKTAEDTPLVKEIVKAIPTMVQDELRHVVDTLKDRNLSSLQQIRSRLEQHKLIFSAGRSAEIAFTTAMIASLPVILALPKLFIGAERHKPVGFLLLGMSVVFTIALLCWKHKPLRTEGGDEVLNRAKRNEAALLTTASANSHLLSNTQAALAVALFSTAAFGLGPLYDLRKAVPPASTGGGSCGSSGGCGGGSCGGGCGGGCGGCGGS